jgi:GNAT superfamily N-acetyltransferase
VLAKPSVEQALRPHRMPSSVVVAPMAEHHAHLPLVAEWFVSEWPNWYGPGGPGNVSADVAAFAESETILPVGVLAFLKGRPVGAGALKAESITSHKHLSPWAAAGYVVPELRGQGIGSALLASLVAKGRAMGYETIYCGTSTAQSLLMRCGWQAIDSMVVEGKQLTVFRSADPPSTARP